ncbi:glycosyltransferase family 4 protein [Ornithinimicrobium pratense]|uniref:D-inositol 3-phosphate glycosyltransferase n=1 Tax=Ornithinimicrobium pratense TaxID=2593973 RepID=A0A5J6V8I9_9MICO|nr:glycosyltransferase family 4 protein [Ornithinimicrobium pratense]QFG69664.1 glycosyltransferase family 4 protein [Ornithinimicrobium pratense]
MRATLVVPDRDPAAPSGGDVYDARLAAHWPDDVQVCRAPGAWPHPTDADRVVLGRLLSGLGEDPVLIDGLVASTVPELVEASARIRATVVLVHSTLSAGSGAQGAAAEELDALELRALRAADLVATTSAWSAADLGRRYGIDGVILARPGVDPAPLSPGSGAAGGPGGADSSGRKDLPGHSGSVASAPQLLTLGALTPVKNHAALLVALAGLRDLDWGLTVAGPVPDREFADHLIGVARDLGLADRVTWPGPLDGVALEQTWAQTDLLAHPSRSETWGMVVTEAHARGIPTVVSRGTGAEEALGWDPVDTRGARGWRAPVENGLIDETTLGVAIAGAAVDTDAPDQLTHVLRRWLTGQATRAAWRSAALERRDRLPGWRETAQVLHDAVAQSVGGSAGPSA